VTNKEIAYDLDISLASVATHLRRALGKLGLSTRAELQMLWGRIDPTLPDASD
jgi:DNA-binding CsgD family transcriptional regulator